MHFSVLCGTCLNLDLMSEMFCSGLYQSAPSVDTGCMLSV